MKIQSIRCQCTREEWLRILDQTFESESTIHQGHAYIYLSKQGHFKSFLSPSNAAEQEFSWKLTIDDIICLSKEYFQNYQVCQSNEVEILQHAYQIMDQGAQRSWWSRLIHWFRGLGFKDTHELIEEQLYVLVEQQLSSHQQQFDQRIEDFRVLVHQLNDVRFNHVYEALLNKRQEGSQTFAKDTPDSLSFLKKQEEELTDLLSEIEQKILLGTKVLFLAEQKDILNRLLLLHPQAPIQQESIEEMESALNTLVDQIVDRFTVHDEDNYQQQLDQLATDLDTLQTQILKDYETQKNYQSELVCHVFSPQRGRSLLHSPIKILPTLKRDFLNHSDAEELLETEEQVEKEE